MSHGININHFAVIIIGILYSYKLIVFDAEKRIRFTLPPELLHTQNGLQTGNQLSMKVLKSEKGLGHHQA